MNIDQNTEKSEESTIYSYKINPNKSPSNNNNSRKLEPQDNIEKSNRLRHLKYKNELSSNFENNENFFENIKEKIENNLNENEKMKYFTK